MRKALMILLFVLGSLSLQAQQVKRSKAVLIDWQTKAKTALTDLAKDKPVVLFTLATECPICQKYAGLLSTLVAAYPQIQFVGVYTKWEDPALIQPFIDGYGLNFPMALDPAHRLIRQLKTEVTPEAFLIAPDGKILYRGSINDWFVGLGKYRTVVTEEYLKDALDAYLAKKPIAKSQTKAIGCIFKV